MIFEVEEVGRVVYSVHVFTFTNHHDMSSPPHGTAHGLLPWDRLPARPLPHNVGSVMLKVAILFLLMPDRLEAYPTCLRPVDHTQTDRAHREGRIDDCRVMIVDF